MMEMQGEKIQLKMMHNQLFRVLGISMLMIILGITNLQSQDLHYARIQDLSMWYNPSLKMDKENTVRLNHRDVRYQGVMGYRSNAAMVDVLIKTDGDSFLSNSAFTNFTMGVAFDESNQNILNNSNIVLGLSHAIPLNGYNQYLALSIQGSYSNSRLDLSQASFPDQFDQNGPIGGAMTQDPLANGNPLNWFSSHLGISLFQETELESWKIGFSVRDVLRPLINRGSGDNFRLSPTIGFQGGYEFERNRIRYGLFGVANFKALANEQLLSLSASQQFNNANLKAFGLGMAYRVRDALIPYVDLKLRNTTIALHYEVNVSGLRAGGYQRNAFELSLGHRFNRRKK